MLLHPNLLQSQRPAGAIVYLGGYEAQVASRELASAWLCGIDIAGIICFPELGQFRNRP